MFAYLFSRILIFKKSVIRVTPWKGYLLNGFNKLTNYMNGLWNWQILHQLSQKTFSAFFLTFSSVFICFHPFLYVFIRFSNDFIHFYPLITISIYYRSVLYVFICFLRFYPFLSAILHFFFVLLTFSHLATSLRKIEKKIKFFWKNKIENFFRQKN